MTPEQKALVENFEKLKIGLDDTFKFHCTECGKCCKHRSDILLTARDVYNMSKELNISIKELISKYCDVYLGEDSHIPIVRILPRGNVERCPFLKSNKCLIHKAKPTICAMFPIGRVLIFPEQFDSTSPANSASPANPVKPKIEYVFNNPGCGDEAESYKVRDWLEMFNIPVNDEFFLLWTDTIPKVRNAYLRLKEKHVSVEFMTLFLNAVFKLMYCSYDLESDKDFLTQFKENKAILDNMTESI